MGNSNSTDSRARPPLRSSVSASSTATVTSAGSSNRTGNKRRKSIELPDLNTSLAFTPTPSPATAQSSASSHVQVSPTAVRGKAKPTVATHKPFEKGELTPTTAAPTGATSFPFDRTDSNDQVPGDESEVYLSGNAQDLQIEGLDKSDDIDDGARLTPSLRKHADALSVVPAQIIPPALDHVLKDRIKESHAISPDPIPLPRNLSLQIASTSAAPATHRSHALPPLQPPRETVVAPEVPNSIERSLGTGAGPTVSLIVGSPIPSQSGTPIASPDLSSLDLNAQPPLAAAALAALQPSATSSPPSKTKTVPLPAAAPLAVLTGNLANDQAAVEAVKAATVDLGAGTEGIPTLLTWTPGEGEGKEGGSAEGEGMPEKVYVTGTFAKGWTTKIELRKKKSQSDFSALVNLPPGPHRLKFIVDKQWKTSRNLPSATDQDGNLINYLQVSVPGTPTSNAALQAQQHIDEEEYWQELLEQRWTTVIPEELIAFGEMQEAEEAAYEAQEEHNRKLVEQGLPPQPLQAPNISPSHPNLLHPVPPPSLPAQLQRGVLNSIVLVASGSGDDSSILQKPDHSVIDHLAASPITKGLLSVGVTKRYRKKFVTTVLYKPTPIG